MPPHVLSKMACTIKIAVENALQEMIKHRKMSKNKDLSKEIAKKWNVIAVIHKRDIKYSASFLNFLIVDKTGECCSNFGIGNRLHLHVPY